MCVEFVKWIPQKVSESYYRQNETERHQGLASAQSEYHQRAGYQLDEWDNDSYNPKRPDRQKRVSVRQEILASVSERAQLKHLHHSGHEEDQSEHKSRE
jgi:hypothetical protein